MTDALTRAAKDASVALGLEVSLAHSGRFSAPTILVELWSPLDSNDGGQPIEQRDVLPVDALAYLEGLEAGARTQKQRHAVLVFLVESVLNWWTQAKVPLRQEALIVPNGEQTIGEALTEALSQLEG